MNQLELSDLYTKAARASINERCASAFLHDVRGTMQALFSAFELLGRSAKLGGDNTVRVEKACDLARRAIMQHEKSTLDVLQLLTLQRSSATTVNVGELVTEVLHFLRNEAATKDVKVAVETCSGIAICVERAKLQTLLVGLMTAAIDETLPGTELQVSVRQEGRDVRLSFGSHAGFGDARNLDQLLDRPLGALRSRELTLLFARQFLAENGGRLEVDCSAQPGAISLYYPGI